MTEDTSPENLRKFLESDDPAMRRMGLSMAKGLNFYPPQCIPHLISFIFEAWPKIYVYEEITTGVTGFNKAIEDNFRIVIELLKNVENKNQLNSKMIECMDEKEWTKTCKETNLEPSREMPPLYLPYYPSLLLQLIGVLNCKGAFEYILSHLNSGIKGMNFNSLKIKNHVELRIGAVKALAYTKDKRALSFILKKTKKSLRITVEEAKEINKIIPDFIKNRWDNEPYWHGETSRMVINTAIESLGELGDLKAIKPLDKLKNTLKTHSHNNRNKKARYKLAQVNQVLKRLGVKETNFRKSTPIGNKKLKDQQVVKYLLSEDLGLIQMGFAMLTGIKQEREHFGLTLGLYMWHHDTVIRRNARKVTLAILDNEQKEAFKAVWKNSYRRLYNKYAIKAALIDIEKYYIQNNLNFEDNLRIAIKSKLTSASRRSENIKPVAINHVSSNQAKYSKLFNNLSEKDKLWIN